MHATNVEPRQGRRSRMLMAGGAAAAAILIALVVLLLQSRDDAPATAQAPPAADAAQNVVNPEKVARGFLEAFGAFDLERVLTYLDPGATIRSIGGQDDPRLLLALLEAQGYKQILGSCEELGSGTGGSTVRCPFDFHAIRSDEIGRGPFSGSYFELVVRDGKILFLGQNWGIEEFSPQVWEPFASWVSKAHPKDAAVMYTDGGGNLRLTEESIRLWKQNTLRYVEEVERNRRRVASASSTGPG